MMDLDLIKDKLLNNAERSKQLASRLTEAGKPLDTWEKELIRVACFSDMKACADDLLMMFLQGDKPRAKDFCSNIQYLLDDLL